MLLTEMKPVQKSSAWRNVEVVGIYDHLEAVDLQGLWTVQILAMLSDNIRALEGAEGLETGPDMPEILGKVLWAPRLTNG
jgi:hypothetical protein